MLSREGTINIQVDPQAELIETVNNLKIENQILELEVERLTGLLRASEKKDDNFGMFEFDEQRKDNEELELMYKQNLEAKDAQIADMEDEIAELRNDRDLLQLNMDFLKKGMDDLNEQLHEKEIKLEFLDEAKQCIRDLNLKVNLLTEQKASLEDQIVRLKKERKTNAFSLNLGLNNSELLDLNLGVDNERSLILKTDTRTRESLFDSVLRTKKEQSSVCPSTQNTKNKSGR